MIGFQSVSYDNPYNQNNYNYQNDLNGQVNQFGAPDAKISGAASNAEPAESTQTSALSNDSSAQNDSIKKIDSGVCQTCKNRKYVDVSNESNVSFQSPQHISPASSATVVMSHEQQHVANAVQKGSQPGAKLVSATVRLITSVCPECGRRYVSGGVTNTLIQYSSNPYGQSQKSIDSTVLTGANVDLEA